MNEIHPFVSRYDYYIISSNFLGCISKAILMLCGKGDGSGIITASHSMLTGMTDSVTVHVDRLVNQLYLFQFSPAVTTTVSYYDGNGEKNVTSNTDPYGIGTDQQPYLWATAQTIEAGQNVTYMGGWNVQELRSGEGIGTLGHLYPRNSLEMRRAAYAAITLLKPDGTPYANETVTLRGGVYRNGEYCEDASFSNAAINAPGDDGETDLLYRTDKNGVLHVYAALNQFTTASENDTVSRGDMLQFIFEIPFGTKANGYTAALTDKYLVKTTSQSYRSVADSTYPFSSIALIRHTATFNDDNLWFDGSKENRDLGFHIKRNGSMATVLVLPFRLVNMFDIERIEEASELHSLMTSIELSGAVTGHNTADRLINGTSDYFLEPVIKILSTMGTYTGTMKAVLSPTEDPTRYTGYFWMGLDTMGLDDVPYNTDGVFVERNFGEFMISDALGYDDFQAMADGSFFKDATATTTAISTAMGIPVVAKMEGWLSTEIRYNFDDMKWDVITTGGGFTAGACAAGIVAGDDLLILLPDERFHGIAGHHLHQPHRLFHVAIQQEQRQHGIQNLRRP